MEFWNYEIIDNTKVLKSTQNKTEEVCSIATIKQTTMHLHRSNSGSLFSRWTWTSYYYLLWSLIGLTHTMRIWHVDQCLWVTIPHKRWGANLLLWLAACPTHSPPKKHWSKKKLFCICVSVCDKNTSNKTIWPTQDLIWTLQLRAHIYIYCHVRGEIFTALWLVFVV